MTYEIMADSKSAYFGQINPNMANPGAFEDRTGFITRAETVRCYV